MKTLQEMTNEVDAELTRIQEEYIKLHQEFDAYRGKPVDENEQAINKILEDIQNKFKEMYPTLYFVASRYEYACNITKAHGEFIDSILKAGGKYNEPRTETH